MQLCNTEWTNKSIDRYNTVFIGPKKLFSFARKTQINIKRIYPNCYLFVNIS